jgi:hypothetical protein
MNLYPCADIVSFQTFIVSHTLAGLPPVQAQECNEFSQHRDRQRRSSADTPIACGHRPSVLKRIAKRLFGILRVTLPPELASIYFLIFGGKEIVNEL